VFVAGAFVDCEGDEVGGGHWWLGLENWIGSGGLYGGMGYLLLEVWIKLFCVVGVRDRLID
jgi:hypothetical protein